MKQIFILIILSLFSVPVYSSCDLTINPSQDIVASLNLLGPNKTLCLEKGIYYPSSTITMQTGQELNGLATEYEVLTQGLLKIKSDADRIIRVADNTTIKNMVITRNTSSTLPTYGILAYYNDNVTIWTVKIKNTKIGIGNVSSDGTRILNVFIKLNGDLYNNQADPAIWISSSSNVEILYGEMRGRANGPGGDGEIGIHNSTNVSIYGTNSVDCGASAFYMVNCDYCSIENTTVQRANEWGLDVVQGSDYFYADNNVVESSNFGGAVFHEYNSINGEWRNNYFYNNNSAGHHVNGQVYCNGINVRDNENNVVLVNNSANTGLASCSVPILN